MKHTATAPPAYRSRRKGGRSLAAYGSPTARTITRQGTTRNDTCPYNNGSEFMSGVVDATGLNGWDYDNIGNLLLQQQGSACDTYTSNALNQYTAIEDQAHDVFTPTYDDDGNQTRIKTSTGIWNVAYNAKNRPVLFSKVGADLTVACTYDYMGRRATKVVTENGVITTSHRFLYRGYLQVACCDRTRANHPCLWLITWDPTQPIATRPLAIQKDGTWYTYGWDLTKNVWEVYGTTGYIGTAYSYTAYGQVTASGAVEQPIQWSSEYNDDELGLVYYNYRHYNPVDGRWVDRDSVTQEYNEYTYIYSEVVIAYDWIGATEHSDRRRKIHIQEQKEKKEKKKERKNNQKFIKETKIIRNTINDGAARATKRTETAADTISHGTELASAVIELIFPSAEREAKKGLQYCQDEINKSNEKSCGCCCIYLNQTQNSFGEISYLIY